MPCPTWVLLQPVAGTWHKLHALLCPRLPPPLSIACPPPLLLPATLFCRYVPWEVAKDNAGDEVLVVDCTHSSAKTITHHKGHHNPPGGVCASDCSTGLVLDVLAASGSAAAGVEVAPWLAKPLIR